jgi:3-oxoacyl-[acyl-carrier-protein] synthase III
MLDILDILGIGLVLPPVRKVRDLVREAGGDPDVHHGWEHACVAAGDDHPSAIAAAALTTALQEARINAAQLSLVLAVGVSRDYLPSWSMATEVMRLHGAPKTCLGFDLTIGCLGSLVGLNTALGWLKGMGGGYAAVVTAEQWSHTIDRKNPVGQPLWAHADGGGAMVVRVGRQGRSLATFHGAVFTSDSELNGLVFVKYGGTRCPTPPPGESPFVRTLMPVPGREIWAIYKEGYTRVFAALRERFRVTPGRVICNQISPKIVTMIAECAGVGDDHACRTGPDYGHVGGADLMIGLRRLIDTHKLDKPVAVTASVPYAVGAGLVTAPRPT